MGRTNRRKGKTYERETANALKAVWPAARRLYGQSRKGADAPDVGGTPFWVECGAGGTIAIRDKVLQALRDSAASEDPRYAGRLCVVFTRTVKNEHLVTMTRDHFLQLMSGLVALDDTGDRRGG